MTTPTVTADRFRRRLTRMMVLRLGLVTAVLAFVTVRLIRDEGEAASLLPAYSFAVGFYILSIGYALALGRVADLRRFTWLQWTLDSFLLAAGAWVLSDVTTVFPQLFVLHILSGGVLLRTRGGLLLATLDAALYTALTVVDVTVTAGISGLGAGLGDDTSTVMIVFRYVSSVLAFYLTAFVAGSLSASEEALASTGSRLEELRELHGNIVDNVRTGLVTVNTLDVVTSCNGAAEQILGVSAVATVGGPLHALFLEAPNATPGAAPSGHSSPGRDSEPWEVRRQTAEGGMRVLRVQASELRDSHGQATGRILQVEDISRLRAVEDQLQREERLVALGRLAAGIVHEVRNPLASISGSIQLLRSELDLTDDDRRLMDIVVREADRLNNLVTNFLGFARNSDPRPVPVRVSRIVQDVLHMVRTQGYERQGIEVVGETGGSGDVMADPDQVRQLVWNLVANALQSMPGGGRLTVTTSLVAGPGASDGVAIPAGEWIQVAVTDTGVGMDAEQQGRMFDPFVTQRAGGTGLGLAIVQRVVEAHEGVIRVKSVPGQGTSIRVLFPVSVGPREPAPPSGGVVALGEA